MNHKNSLDKLLEILKLIVVLETSDSDGGEFHNGIEGWNEACALNCRCCNPDLSMTE